MFLTATSKDLEGSSLQSVAVHCIRIPTVLCSLLLALLSPIVTAGQRATLTDDAQTAANAANRKSNTQIVLKRGQHARQSGSVSSVRRLGRGLNYAEYGAPYREPFDFCFRRCDSARPMDNDRRNFDGKGLARWGSRQQWCCACRCSDRSQRGFQQQREPDNQP